MTRRILMLAGATALALAVPAQSGPPEAPLDVPADHWARPAVDKVLSAGLFGTSNGRFEGEGPVNKFHLAVALARTLDRVEGRQNKAGEVEALQKLVAELADELAVLNRKVEVLQDEVVALKKGKER